MNKKLAILAALLPTIASAQFYGNNDIIIQPQIMDFEPNDGLFDAGTSTNPYEIKDRSGNLLGTIQPQIIDITPNDGLFDAGSSTNPYVIKRR